MRNNQAFLWTKVPVIDTILLMKATTAAALFPTPLSLEQAAAFTPQQVLMAVQGWQLAEQQAKDLCRPYHYLIASPPI